MLTQSDMTVASSLIVSAMVIAFTTLSGWAVSRKGACSVSYTLIGAVLGVMMTPYVWAAIVLAKVERDLAANMVVVDGELMTKGVVERAPSDVARKVI